MRITTTILLSASVLLVACGGGGDTAAAGGGTINSGTGTVGATGLPLYVLVGGSSRPSGTNIFLDSKLAAGEIFIMAQAPLAPNTNHTVAVSASTGTETFTHTWSFTTGATNAIPLQSTPLAELNALRAQCTPAAALTPLTPFSLHTGYVTSTTKHAGYQSEISTLTHYESQTTRQFYVNNDFDLRITAGCTAAADPGPFGYGTGINMVGEDIASNGGVAAIDNLWNTVYHRLPMMRSQYFKVGVADRSDAYAHPFNNSPYSQVIALSTPAYLTLDFGGNSGIAQVSSYWPTDNQPNVYYSFLTDNEGPDPVSTGNPNGTPTDNEVGVPIHVILPTTQPFTSLTITVTP